MVDVRVKVINAVGRTHENVCNLERRSIEIGKIQCFD